MAQDLEENVKSMAIVLATDQQAAALIISTATVQTTELSDPDGYYAQRLWPDVGSYGTYVGDLLTNHLLLSEERYTESKIVLNALLQNLPPRA